MALAGRLEHARDRVLREPFDLEVGVEHAQLAARSRRRATRAPARSGRRRCSPRASAGGSPVAQLRRRLRPLVDALGEVAQRVVDQHRMARHQEVPDVLELEQLGGGQGLRSTAPRSGGSEQIRVAVDDHQRARHAPRAGRRSPRGSSSSESRGVCTSVSGVGLQAPLDRVLERLGAVRLREALLEEELEEALVVLLPVVAVGLRPALVGRGAPRRRSGPVRSGSGGLDRKRR